MLSAAQFADLIELLEPVMTTEADRRQWLQSIPGTAPLDIDTSGTPTEATRRIVLVLLDGGEAEPGKPVLAALLEQIRPQVSPGTQQHLNRLIEILNESEKTVGYQVISSAGKYLFISYSRADLSFIERLRRDLQAAGVNIWIDKIGLKPGTPDWEQALRDAIAQSDGVLLVASPHSRRSPYVRDEMAIARMHNKPIFPIWIEGTEYIDAIPIGMSYVQNVDMRGAAYSQGLAALLTMLTEDTAAASPPRELVPPGELKNPYKGLKPFRAKDRAYFFGRSDLVKSLVEVLRDARFLAIVGASGSGKSSAAMAGLLPALHEGALPDSETWCYVEPFVPGVHPLENLTIALARHFPEKSQKVIREDLEDRSTRGLHTLARQLCLEEPSRLVLYIDQFEELFTLTQDDAERQQFINLVTTAVNEPGGSVIVIMSLRADFYDRPLYDQALGQLFQAHTHNVLPMTLADLEEVVQEPANLVGLSFDDGLVSELVFAVRGEPRALPLLQFTLDRLYENREGNRLTLAAYRALGGLRGALAQHAEATYANLPDDEHRALARALFLRLIEPGATEQDTTRRRATLAELQLEDAARTAHYRAVADAFVTARLLTTDRVGDVDTIEVSHEAVIREWARLADWLKGARDDILLRKALTSDAAGWQQHGRSNDRLYRGTQLAEALAWAEQNTASAHESAFLAASRDQAARMQQRRRLTRSAFAAVILLIPLLLAGFFFDRSQREAENSAALGTQAALARNEAINAENARATSNANAATSSAAELTAVYSGSQARSQALAANAIQFFQEGNTDLAVLQAIEANQIDYPSIQARRALYQAAYNAAARYIISLYEASGETLVQPSDNPTNIVLTADSRKAIVYYAHALLTFDTQTGALLDRVRFDEENTGFELSAIITTQAVDGIQLHPDGHSIFLSMSVSAENTADLLSFTLSENYQLKVKERPIVQVSLVDGHEIQRFDREGEVLFNAPFVVTPDGTRLYIADTVAGEATTGFVSVWDVSTGRPISRIDVQDLVIQNMAITPDGAALLVGGLTSTFGYQVKRIDLAAQTVQTDQLGPSGALALSHDGQTAATLNNGGLWLWDAATGEDISWIDVPYQDWDTLTTIQFSPDDQRIAIGSTPGNISVVDLQTRQISILLKGHLGAQIRGLAFSADGTQLLTTADDDVLRIWNVEPSEALASFFAAHPSPEGDNLTAWLQMTGDGQIIGYQIDEHELYQFNAVTGEILSHHPVAADYAWPISVSADGTRVIFTTHRSEVVVYDAQRQQEVRRIASDSDMTLSLGVSPDQHWLLVVEGIGFKLYDLTTGELVRKEKFSLAQWSQNAADISAAFSPDGTKIVSGTYDGRLREYRLDDFSLVREFPDTVRVTIFVVAYSPDGSRLLTGSADGQVTLWDAQTGEILYTFPSHRGWVEQVAFSPDGQTAMSAAKVTYQGTSPREIRLWRILYEDNLLPWVYTNRAVREFTCEERDLYGIQPPCGRGGYFPTRTPAAPLAASAPQVYEIYTPLPALPTWVPTPTPTPTPPATVSAVMGEVYAARFNPDNDRILTNSSDGAVRLWDVHSGQLLRSYAGYLTPAPRWSPDGTRFFTRNVPDIVQIWDSASGQLLTTLSGHRDAIIAAYWSGDGTRVLTASNDYTVRVWDAVSGEQLIQIGKADPIDGATWSPDVTRIAVYTEDNFIIIYDAVSGEELQVIEVGGPMGGFNAPNIYSVVWSPDGTRLLVTTFGDAAIWNAITGEQEVVLTGQPMVLIGDWTDDGLSVVTTSYLKGTTIVWDAITGEQRFLVRGKPQQTCIPEYSPDENLLYTCEGEKLSLWNARTGELAHEMVNTSAIYNAYWSSDNHFIAAATSGGIVQIWDIASGTEVQRLGRPAGSAQ